MRDTKPDDVGMHTTAIILILIVAIPAGVYFAWIAFGRRRPPGSV